MKPSATCVPIPAAITKSESTRRNPLRASKCTFVMSARYVLGATQRWTEIRGVSNIVIRLEPFQASFFSSAGTVGRPLVSTQLRPASLAS